MESDQGFTDNGYVLNSYFIPQEILVRLLSFLNPVDLVRCRRVCKTWKYLIDDDNEVWKLMVVRSDVDSLSKFSTVERKKLISNNPWYLNYSILSNIPFEKNLLQNNCGQEKLKHWTVTRPYEPRGENALGDRFWDVEPQPIFTNPLPESEDFGSNTCCFSTSYVVCKKHQEIDLIEKGFPRRILDKFQPPITISEWYSGRYDCGSKYNLRIDLLDEDRKNIVKRKEIEKRRSQWQDREWRKVTKVFKKYGRGLRYLVFDHEGIDTQFWAGNYGSKMSGGVVKLSFPRIAISK